MLVKWSDSLYSVCYLLRGNLLRKNKRHFLYLLLWILPATGQGPLSVSSTYIPINSNWTSDSDSEPNATASHCCLKEFSADYPRRPLPKVRGHQSRLPLHRTISSQGSAMHLLAFWYHLHTFAILLSPMSQGTGVRIHQHTIWWRHVLSSSLRFLDHLCPSISSANYCMCGVHLLSSTFFSLAFIIAMTSPSLWSWLLVTWRTTNLNFSLPSLIL